MNIFRKGLGQRVIFFLLADIILISLAIYLAFFLRFDGTIPSFYFTGGVFWQMLAIILIFALPTFYSFDLYFFSWSYVSTEELVALLKATTLSFFLFGCSLIVLRELNVVSSFPRSTVITSYLLTFLFSGAIRISKRIFLQLFKTNSGKIKVLIVGAGDIGEQLIRSISSSKNNNYLPVGFVDDSLSKKGVRIHGLQVLGEIKNIPEYIKEFDVEELIIALNPKNNAAIKIAVEKGRQAGLKKIKTVPVLTEFISGEITLKNLKDVQVEDLLGRDPVEINTKAIGEFITDKVVLITGAAGSIGSELTRQVAKFNPKLLVLLDQDETGIFNISNEITKKYAGVTIKSFVANILDDYKVNNIFADYKPAIVFHAAAYKHVPLMEEQPEQAVKNNIFGTKKVAEAALRNGAEKFVLISTDKAVNPTSIMGASKRICEMVCQSLNQKGQTKFISVRFGNVLDSRGSVIPIFKEQIKRRGPVEVTHPEMKRYFMLIPEACLLVMQAGQMGNGGEVFVLNMGTPVKILDLAKEMIRLSGFEPDKDIPIVFVGTRPGEKLFEEILNTEEGTMATGNRDIFIAKLQNSNEEKLDIAFEKFSANGKLSKPEIVAVFSDLIPTYTPSK